MSPIEYLRGVVLRDRATPAPESKLPPAPSREIPWANSVRTAGACVHDVIYSRCNCPATSISAQTNPADFPADQHS